MITNVFNEYYNQCNGKVLPVISAGNSSNPDVLPPGHLNSVISVGALTWDRTWCEFSSGKCAADVATFGENLILRLNRQVSKIIIITKNYIVLPTKWTHTHLPEWLGWLHFQSTSSMLGSKAATGYNTVVSS